MGLLARPWNFIGLTIPLLFSCTGSLPPGVDATAPPPVTTQETQFGNLQLAGMVPLTSRMIATEYQLRAPDGGPYTNFRGGGEKYYRGKSLGEDNGGWYFIKDNGALYAFSFSGGLAGSRLIAVLDPSYYAYPLLLADEGLPSGLISDVNTLQARYGLQVSSSGLFTNNLGWNENYLIDANGNWYFVMPTGSVFLWTGTMFESTPIATGISIGYYSP